jgi:hypothetical protein
MEESTITIFQDPYYTLDHNNSTLVLPEPIGENVVGDLSLSVVTAIPDLLRRLKAECYVVTDPPSLD